MHVVEIKVKPLALIMIFLYSNSNILSKLIVDNYIYIIYNSHS